MNLSHGELESLRDVAIQAARAAGDLIERRSTTRLSVERKVAGESLASQVVTEIDRAAESLILEMLTDSVGNGNIGLLTEETQDDGSRFEKDFFWCIDPLDGTLPFVEGVAGYAVSIALVQRGGQPLIGVVYDPRRDDLYDAAAGLGCRFNGDRFEVSVNSDVSVPTRVFGDRSSRGLADYSALLGELVAGEEVVAENGCLCAYGAGAAMNACGALLAERGCYFKLPKKSLGGGSVWDFAATCCLYEEAGAWVSDLFGDPLELNPRGSCFMNERGVLFATNEGIANRIRKTYTKSIKTREGPRG